MLSVVDSASQMASCRGLGGQVLTPPSLRPCNQSLKVTTRADTNDKQKTTKFGCPHVRSTSHMCFIKRGRSMGRAHYLLYWRGFRINHPPEPCHNLLRPWIQIRGNLRRLARLNLKFRYVSTTLLVDRGSPKVDAGAASCAKEHLGMAPAVHRLYAQDLALGLARTSCPMVRPAPVRL